MSIEDDQIEIIIALPDTMQFRQALVTELRDMACGKPPYEAFRNVSPRTKAVWRVAATLLGAEFYSPC